jgi:predicted lipase
MGARLYSECYDKLQHSCRLLASAETVRFRAKRNVVVVVVTNVSEEYIAYIFRVYNRNGDDTLVTMYMTTWRHNSEDHNPRIIKLANYFCLHHFYTQG